MISSYGRLEQDRDSKNVEILIYLYRPPEVKKKVLPYTFIGDSTILKDLLCSNNCDFWNATQVTCRFWFLVGEKAINP